MYSERRIPKFQILFSLCTCWVGMRCSSKVAANTAIHSKQSKKEQRWRVWIINGMKTSKWKWLPFIVSTSEFKGKEVEHKYGRDGCSFYNKCKRWLKLLTKSVQFNTAYIWYTPVKKTKTNQNLITNQWNSTWLIGQTWITASVNMMSVAKANNTEMNAIHYSCSLATRTYITSCNVFN